MSDKPTKPSAPAPSKVVVPATPRTPVSGREVWLPVLCAIGFVLLAGAIYYVWQNPVTPDQLLANANSIRAVDARVGAVDARVSRIEQMPAPPSAADLGKVSARIDALEGRIGDQTRIATRIDEAGGRIEALTNSTQTSLDGLKQQLDAANARVAALQEANASVINAAARVDRLVRIQAASIALANGRPLGNLPGAPPALARFADKPPPTEAQLRLSFAQVQRAALAASKVDTTERPFIERALGKAEELMTIRRGNDVVVGNSTAAALGQADAAVQAGDFPTALKAMDQLDPSAQHAAADWVAQVKAMLDARAALADMAAHP